MFKGRILVILLLLLSVSFVAAQVYTPDANTVALWHFDECNGDFASDSSGNGNTGTLNNVEWTTDSISGCAVKFNGVNSVIPIVKTSSVDLTRQVTLEAWVKRNSQQDGTIISKNGPYFIAIRNNKLHGGIYSNDGNCPTSCVTPGANTWIEIEGITNLEIGKWYHTAITYDSNKIMIYVNGIEETSAVKTGQMPQVSQSINLGWGEPGQNQYFDGLIDEARISNIARTSFDIATTTVSTTTTSTILTTTIPYYTKEEVDALLAERDARITSLENQTSDLIQLFAFLTERVSSLENTLSRLQVKVNDLFISLFGLPKGLRQEMICSSMKATNQTFAEGFGLTCNINDKGACSCS